MNLFEYQAKQILKKYEVPTPHGFTATSAEEALASAKKIQKNASPEKWVVKAQVLAGGRGKAGGIKIADSLDDLEARVSQILGMKLITPQTPPEGILVNKVLIEEFVYNKGKMPIRELYLSILMNRATSQNIIMYSPGGGMDIEQTARKRPDSIFYEIISPESGLLKFQCRKIAYNLGLSGQIISKFELFLKSLYNAYVQSDATLLEINPLLITSDERVLAVDTKMTIDDNSLIRHPEFQDLANEIETDPIEKQAKEHRLNYVKLNGNVGCMVNGAGLAMATMDIIKLSGGEPANFLDVGGAANPASIEQAFRIILADKNVRAILINIFGGIVRCDRVASGIVEAYRKIGDIDLPVILRLKGNNAIEARSFIENSGMKVRLAADLRDAAKIVTESIRFCSADIRIG